MAETLRGFVNIYEELSSFPEIFLPISALLHELLQKAELPGILRGNMENVIDLIKKKSDEHHMLRQPLEMRKQKPVPIKLLNPKFEEKYSLFLKLKNFPSLFIYSLLFISFVRKVYNLNLICTELFKYKQIFFRGAFVVCIGSNKML